VTDQLLLVSRIALLALVYLVFLRVARAVIVEIRAESRVPNTSEAMSSASAMVATAAGPSKTASPPPRPVDAAPSANLTVVAPEPMMGMTFALSSETTIGRAPGCGVLIEDERISKLHARVFSDGIQWMIEDLGSTNGTKLNNRTLTSTSTFAKGDRIQVGEVVMELS